MIYMFNVRDLATFRPCHGINANLMVVSWEKGVLCVEHLLYIGHKSVFHSVGNKEKVYIATSKVENNNIYITTATHVANECTTDQ